MNKKEIKYLDPESNYNTDNKLINNSFFTNYEEELKAIQRSIALLRQDLPKIVHDELIKLLNER
jgi:hypothetical protein